MLEFFAKIGDLISMLIEFIISMLKNLFQLLAAVPKTYAAIIDVLSLMPPFITVPVVCFVSVCVLVVVINQWG